MSAPTTAPTAEELAARTMERIKMATTKLSKAPENGDHDYTERHANDHKKHERIWLLPNDGEQVTWCDMDASEDGSGQEYVRADLVAAAIRQHSAPLEAQIAELTAENERVGKLLTADLSLLRMGPSELGFTMDAAGRAVAIIAGHLATWLEAHHAENYTETAFEQIDISGGARKYILTVQRGEGKSPHQLRKDAEAALSAMTAERDKLREALEREAAWNEAEAAICDQQAVAARTGGGTPSKPFFEGAAHTHRKAARRLSADLQPKEAGNVR